MNYKKTILVLLVVLLSLPLVSAVSSNDFVKIEVGGQPAYTHKDLIGSRYLVASDSIFYGSSEGQITMKLYLKDKVASGNYRVGLRTKSKNITVKSIGVDKSPSPVLSVASTSYDYPNLIYLDVNATEVNIVIEFDPNEIGLLEEFDIILYNDKGEIILVYDPFISGFTFRKQMILNTSGIGLSGNVTIDHAIPVQIAPGDSFWTSDPCGDGTGITFAGSDETTELNFDDVNFNLTDNNFFINIEYTETFDSSVDVNAWFYWGGTCVNNSDGNAAYPSGYIRFYHANEASGNLSDSTINAGTATANGTPIYSEAGQINTAIKGDAGADFFLDSQVLADGNNFSFLTWVNFTGLADIGNGGGLLSQYVGASADRSVFRILDNNKVSFFKGDQGALATTSQTITRGAWHQLGFTINGTSGALTLYLDSNSDGTGTDATNTWPAEETGYLGYDEITNAILGRQDEFRIFNYVLSSDEVILLYNADINNLITFGAEESLTSASFTVTGTVQLDPENGIISVDRNFTNNSIPIDANFFWSVDSVQESTDVNFTRAFTSAGDFNISLVMDTAGTEFQSDQTVSIVSLPQNMDINFLTNTFPASNADVNFGVTFTGSADSFNWGFPGDANVATRNVNKTYSVSGTKTVCVTTTSSSADKTFCENFLVGRVIVKKPLDISTLVELTPFNMDASANPPQSFSALSVDTNFFFFSDADFSSRINIDFNVDYFPTSRIFDFTGVSNDFEFQPYLTIIAGNLASIIFTIDNINQKQTIQGIKIVSETVISGTLTEVESKLSDITGTAEFHFELGRDYVLSFFDSDGDLIFSGTLTAKSVDTTLFAALAQQVLFGTADPTSNFNLSWNPVVSQVNPVDGNITIVNTINPFNTVIGDVNVFISHISDSNIIFERVFTLDSSDQNKTITYDLNVAGFDDDILLKVSVQVFDVNGLQIGNIQVKNYSFKVSRIFGAFESLKEELGAFPVMFLSIIFCVLIVGLVTFFSTNPDNNWVGPLALVATAFFVLITWIPLEAWLVAASMSIGLTLWRDREQ